jgi:inner membrane protein
MPADAGAPSLGVFRECATLAAMLSMLHFLTHIGLSWLVARVGRASRRDSWLVTLAGVLPDLDGAGIVWSHDAYLAAHRAVGHGAPFGLMLVGFALWRADARWSTAALTAVSFHLHLALDLVGTGGLAVRYLWPMSDWGLSYRGHWVLASWPNALVMAATLLGVLGVAWRARRVALAGRPG